MGIDRLISLTYVLVATQSILSNEDWMGTNQERERFFVFYLSMA